VPQGNFQRIVKNVSKKSSPDRISNIIYRSSLKQSVNKCILTELKKETAAMCSTKNVSTLRKIDSENLATFKFETLISEIRLNAPLMYSIFNQIVKGSAIGTAVTAAVALRFRNKHMSSFHHVVSQILDHGGATDEVHIY